MTTVSVFIYPSPVVVSTNSDDMEQDNRDINADTIRRLSVILAERVGTLSYTGDMSDLGNEIGIAVGTMLPGITEDETWDLIAGVRHGLSLTNNTH